MATCLVIGAAGQLGIELTLALQAKYGVDEVHISDIRAPQNEEVMRSRFLSADAMDSAALDALLATDGGYQEVYHLAAMLSAVGEKHPLKAWDLNMQSLLLLLEAGKAGRYERLFWPSSIAVFGDQTPKHLTPQNALLDPTTVYGISKQAGEWWCQYYHNKFGVDVRSLRYPGLIGHRSMPGGGTTDYAVDIFHVAARGEAFSCFLEADEALPMMYMDDAVRATLELMAAPAAALNVRTSYNLAGLSFTPAELAQAIQHRLPEFEIHYAPDERQAIAASWPDSIDDSTAQREWGWQPAIDLDALVDIMLEAQLAATSEGSARR
jgi:nucleoside-diphosphate-sugar epimerase